MTILWKVLDDPRSRIYARAVSRPTCQIEKLLRLAVDDYRNHFVLEERLAFKLCPNESGGFSALEFEIYQ